MKTTLKSFLVAGLLLIAPGMARAQYLDYSEPARAKSLGGNLVAMPEGPSAPAYNPAGLGLQDRFEASARYESLFPGLENDSLSTGNLTLLSPTDAFGAIGAFGASWDHLGGNLLSQDRFILDWGKAVDTERLVTSVAGGLSLSYLTQRYTLQAPLAGVSENELSSSSFAFGAGLLVSFSPRLTLGFSAEDLNNPNLGVIGIDRQPVLLRWGLAAVLLNSRPLKITATAAQSYADPQLTTMGGVEVLMPEWGLCLRGGTDPYQGAVGFGYELADLFLDYAYTFSISGLQQVGNSVPPGSHLLELGLKWGNSPTSTAYSQYLKRAQEAEAQGRWEKANWYYLECFAMRPDKSAIEGHNRVLLNYNRERAATCFKDGQTARNNNLFIEARNDFELATKLDPGNGDYAKALAEVALQAARLQSDQEVAESIRKIGDLAAKDDLKGARREADVALAQHPHNGALELVKSSLQEEPEPEPETPSGPATTAAQAAKVNAKLATTEADLYLSRGQTDLAKENLKAALKAQPKNVDIQRKLQRLEQPTPVVSEENRQKGQALYEKGLMNYLQGNLTQAIQDWEDALKFDPTNTRVQNNLVRAKIEEKMEHP